MTTYKINYTQISHSEAKHWLVACAVRLSSTHIEQVHTKQQTIKMEKYVYTYERLHLYVRKSMYQTLTCICVNTYKHMYIYGI